MSLKRYDYKCQECRRIIDVSADITPPKTCAYCGGKMFRVFGTPHVIYKGYDFVGPAYHEKRDK